MARELTKEVCLEIASSCFNRNELQKKDCYVYKIMYKNGWLEEVFPSRFMRANTYTYEQLKEIASQYPTRNSFKCGDYNAYHVALRRGFLNDICKHMVKGVIHHKADKIYFLKSDKFHYEDPIYKIGVTHRDKIEPRLIELKYESGFNFSVLQFHKVEDANILETELLKFGVIPSLKPFKGSTECRALTQHEMILVQAQIESRRVGIL